MSNNTDSGGINGGMTGGAGSIHGGRGNDSRTLSDGNNTGWAGGSAGGGNTPNVSGAQEVVLSTSGGLGEAETSGVILNVIPRDGGNNFSGQISGSGANGAMQGSNYTQSLQDQGLRTPSELLKVYDFNPMGGGRIIRDKLWFYATYRQTAPRPHGARHVDQQERRQPERLGRRLRQRKSPRSTTTSIGTASCASRGRLRRATRYRPTGRSSTRPAPIRGGGTATTTPEASTYTLFQPSHINSATWSSPVSSRLLHGSRLGQLPVAVP